MFKKIVNCVDREEKSSYESNAFSLKQQKCNKYFFIFLNDQ